MTQPIKKWRCPECMSLHNDEGSAAECCPPDITAVYVCAECGSENWSEEDARLCCADDETLAEADNALAIPKKYRDTPDYIQQFNEANHLIGV